MDPSHAVRVVVVSGICRVSAIYWEFIPAEKIRTLISTIVQKLAWDSSSADVRHAVVKVSKTTYTFWETSEQSVPCKHI